MRTMRILCTFPGKFGDLLWALPTIRSISKRVGAPVDLALANPLESIVPLLKLQPYIGECVALKTWQTQDTAPISPRTPPHMSAADAIAYAPPYGRILHLGYRDWPIPDVVQHTWETALSELAPDAMLEPPDLTTPWITVPPGGDAPVEHWRWPWVYGFTDEHFELKIGLVHLLEQKPYWWKGSKTLSPTTIGANPRWQAEAGYTPTSWVDSARMLRYTDVFLGDCSALHVLAVAMGVPVVLMEPNPHRHNHVFYPLGTEGPAVQLVRGIDGSPTFDARHVRDVLNNVLAAQRSKGVGSSLPPER